MGKGNAGWRRELLKPHYRMVQDAGAQHCVRHGLRALRLHNVITRCAPLLRGCAAEHGVNHVHGEAREDVLHRLERAGVLKLLHLLLHEDATSRRTVLVVTEWLVIAPSTEKPWLPGHEARMLRACRVELVEKMPPSGMRMLVQMRLRMRLLLRVATQGVVHILLGTRRKSGLVP